MTRHARQPPGTLIAHPDAPRPRVRAIAYGPDAFEEHEISDLAQVRQLVGRHPVLWLNVDGLGDAAVIQGIGEIFGLHPLALEDILDTSQRPKVDEYPPGLFISLRMAELRDSLLLEQVSVFVAPGVVLTFQETVGDCLDELRDRIRRARGRVRRSPAAYLAYAITDAIIDGYFLVLERYGDELEELESAILSDPSPDLVARLFGIKRELLAMRRAVWPMRDVASRLAHEPLLGGEEIRMYARDAHDHAARILDLVENFRELSTSMIDVYLATSSNRMNEIIKVLTIISTIFIPLGFIAGVYGMNFSRERSPFNMPELDWYFGYPFALLLMGVVAAALLAWFWRRGWFGGRTAPPPNDPPHHAVGGPPAPRP